MRRFISFLLHSPQNSSKTSGVAPKLRVMGSFTRFIPEGLTRIKGFAPSFST